MKEQEEGGAQIELMKTERSACIQLLLILMPAVSFPAAVVIVFRSSSLNSINEVQTGREK